VSASKKGAQNLAGQNCFCVKTKLIKRKKWKSDEKRGEWTNE